ncbi:uncharacterized protein [Nicotiana sylvestris]|uniref:uncharacterized protein n=1 Tax=Nicotiana sylvestris TaxID=4096 RepID=UPI00388C4C86
MEFARLCDYADMIKQTNPGSSCWVRMDSETKPGKNLFVYFYVCFDALKKGELLVAVGKNGNQQMFPIAWAVVDQETKYSWSFFINYLKDDLQLGTGEGLTVMAICKRMCARHILSNWHKKWKGEERRKQFWRCSKSSYEVKFKEELEKMDKLSKDICGDLLYYPKNSWVKAYFEVHSKCDVVENNMCETFNSWILASRHKSIITMLEEIRRKIMTRQVDMLKFVVTWISDISPMARLLLEDSKDLARKCTVLWNVDVGFEIGEGLHKHVVNLSDKPGTSSQRVMVSGSTYKSAAPTGIDLGFKARSLRWKGQDAVTTFQLQQMKLQLEPYFIRSATQGDIDEFVDSEKFDINKHDNNRNERKKRREEKKLIDTKKRTETRERREEKKRFDKYRRRIAGEI